VTPICAYALAAAVTLVGVGAFALFMLIYIRFVDWASDNFGGVGLFVACFWPTGIGIIGLFFSLAAHFAKTCCAR
jgi:hypothetical protein